MEVWVLISGAYSGASVEAVFSSAEAGMAANPIPAKPHHPAPLAGWRQVGDGCWDNGLDWDEGLCLERFEVDADIPDLEPSDLPPARQLHFGVVPLEPGTTIKGAAFLGPRSGQ